MIAAVVVGNIWSTRRIDGLPVGAMLEVAAIATGERLIAFDVLGSGAGEQVLVCEGRAASQWLPGGPPIDALIIGSIDRVSEIQRPAASAEA